MVIHQYGYNPRGRIFFFRRRKRVIRDLSIGTLRSDDTVCTTNSEHAPTPANDEGKDNMFQYSSVPAIIHEEPVLLSPIETNCTDDTTSPNHQRDDHLMKKEKEVKEGRIDPFEDFWIGSVVHEACMTISTVEDLIRHGEDDKPTQSM